MFYFDSTQIISPPSQRGIEIRNGLNLKAPINVRAIVEFGLMNSQYLINGHGAMKPAATGD